jgi:hypothetical protein
MPPKTIDDLFNKICMTAIVVPSTGRIIAYQFTWLDALEAMQIACLKSVMRDLVYGKRPNSIFQKSQADGTGLVDIDGNVY